MRPRMYGSSESHRFLTRTSPSLGFGSGAFSRRKFASVTQPAGRLARTTRRFSVKRCEAREVVVGVAELLRDHGEAPEGMAHLQLLAHAHAAVQLDRLLAHEARVVGDLDLRRRDGPGAVLRA